jgi:hypothetical protein
MEEHRRAEGGSQRSEVGSQRLWYQERGRILEHGTEHAADGMIQRDQFVMLRCTDVAAVVGKVQRRVGLGVFAVTVGQLADEVRFVASFGPSFT